MPIINPLDTEMMDTIAAFKVLWGIDQGANQYLASFNQLKQTAAPKNRQVLILYPKLLFKVVKN